MRPRSSLVRSSWFALAAPLLLAVAPACSHDTSPRVPSADFIVTAGDSAFWVSATDGRLRMRRAPLTLAQVGGRFYEVYVSDDDHSYYDALLIGQRIYRRDLISGDSVQVFEDTLVSRIAREYAARHPRERPLDDDEDGSDDPHTVATTDIELLDVLGPLVSFERHTDIDIVSVENAHDVRRSVVDLRDGSVATLRAIFGDTAAHRIVTEGRNAYRVVVDSIRRSRSANGQRAARAIGAFRFDSTSFGLVDIDGRPMVGFYVAGDVASEGELSLPLPHVSAPTPGWWNDVSSSVPTIGADSASEIWGGNNYDVIARYDSTGDYATLIVRDTASREWAVGRVPTPTRGLYRLDIPSVDSTARRGLARAFDESALYSESARTVLGPRVHRTRVQAARGPARRSATLRPVSRPAARRLDLR